MVSCVVNASEDWGVPISTLPTPTPNSTTLRPPWLQERKAKLQTIVDAVGAVGGPSISGTSVIRPVQRDNTPWLAEDSQENTSLGPSPSAAGKGARAPLPVVKQVGARFG